MPHGIRKETGYAVLCNEKPQSLRFATTMTEVLKVVRSVPFLAIESAPAQHSRIKRNAFCKINFSYFELGLISLHSLTKTLLRIHHIYRNRLFIRTHTLLRTSMRFPAVACADGQTQFRKSWRSVSGEEIELQFFLQKN